MKLMCQSLIARLAVALAAAALAVTLAATPASASQSRVIGGTSAADGAWPWMTAIVDRTTANAYYGQFCGGSLISPTRVLTASHCILDTAPTDIDVVVGRNDLSNSSDGQRIHVTGISTAPGANGAADPPRNDLAMLELETPATDPQSGSVPLVVPGDDDPKWAAGMTATVTGWGNTSTSGTSYPDDLKQADVKMVSDSTCSSEYGSDFHSSDMVCAADTGKDTCQGDSGGPLVVGDGSGGWLLAGVTSWGNGCADPDFAGVYVRVGASSLNAYANSSPTFAPYPVSSPTVTGAAAVGSVLTCSNGTWDGDPATYSYTWARDTGTGFATVAGATGSTLALSDSDAAARVSCSVRAQNAGGSYRVESPAVGPIAGRAAPTPPAVPVSADIFVPRATALGRRCTRTRCTITVRVSDGTDTTGIAKVSASLTSTERRRCGAGHRRICVSSHRRRVSARAKGGALWVFVLRRLRPGTQVLKITAVDRAGRAQAVPTRYAFRFKRR
jgi:hypothetical protein